MFPMTLLSRQRLSRLPAVPLTSSMFPAATPRSEVPLMRAMRVRRKGVLCHPPRSSIQCPRNHMHLAKSVKQTTALRPAWMISPPSSNKPPSGSTAMGVETSVRPALWDPACRAVVLEGAALARCPVSAIRPVVGAIAGGLPGREIGSSSTVEAAVVDTRMKAPLVARPRKPPICLTRSLRSSKSGRLTGEATRQRDEREMGKEKNIVFRTSEFSKHAHCVNVIPYLWLVLG